MNDISFKSQIRTVSNREFYNITNRMGKKAFVDYPWTIKQGVANSEAFTTNISDCTFFCINDGQNVLLKHICPSVEENRNFSSIENHVKTEIQLFDRNNLSGFIAGADNSIKESAEFLKKIEGLFKKLQIPFSKFYGSKESFNAAYISSKDELIISSKSVDPNLPVIKNLEKIFKHIKISEEDCFV